MQQITVKEINDWEGETFNYVLYVTEDQKELIKLKCEMYGDDTLSVQETNYTGEEFKSLDEASGNTYMDYIAFYRLNENALEGWKEFGGCFYKGVGLEKIKSPDQLELCSIDDIMSGDLIGYVNKKNVFVVRKLHGWDEDSCELMFANGISIYVNEDEIYRLY